MKKVKYFIFSIICLFSCSIVFAENEIVIKSVTPEYDESSSIVVTNDDNNYNVTFTEKNQIVKYNLVLENTTDKDLEVSAIKLIVPSEFLITEVDGMDKKDIIKSKDTRKVTITLKTSSDEDLRESFDDKVYATLDFNEAIENPFTSTKGLIVILLAATIVTGGCIIIYRNNKAARYMALVIICLSIVPNVKAAETITLNFEVNVKYRANFDWSNKTATFVGDSITNSVGTTKAYYQYLDDNLDFKSTTVLGVNGSTFSAKSDYGTARNPLINRYQNIPHSDLVIIYMGTNDYGHETPMGTINDDEDVSFYGALNVIISSLQKDRPNSTIVLATPIHRYGAGTSGILGTAYTYDNIPNGRGLTLEDYVVAMKNIAKKYELPLIDLFTLVDIDPTSAEQRTKYIPDGLHPNAEGHKVIANVIENALLDIKPKKQVTNEDEDNNTEPSEPGKVEMTYGNDFSTQSQWYDDQTRASTTKNIYLTKGTVISLINPTEYNIAVYEQASETMVQGEVVASLTSGWTPQNIIIPKDGWYGITIKKLSGETFNFNGTDDKYLDSYVTYQTIEMQIGNKYYIDYVNTPNRMSVTRNVYLKKGTIITVNDLSTYMLGVFAQYSPEITLETISLQSWASKNYTIPSDGWYGIAFKRVDDANLVFGTVDSKNLADYVTFQ